VLLQVAIGSLGILVALGVGIALRADAIETIAKDVAAKNAREAAMDARIAASGSLDRAAKEQLFGEAVSAAFTDAMTPVSTMPWTAASYLALGALVLAVIAGAYWATSRTGLWQAGAGVGVVAAVAWIVVVAVAYARLHSMAEVMSLLTAAGSRIGRRRVSSSSLTLAILSDPTMDWSVLFKAGFLVVGPAWAGTTAGMKGWAARLNRDLYRPSTPSEVQALFGPGLDPQPTPSPTATSTPGPRSTASWDPLAETPAVGPAVIAGMAAGPPGAYGNTPGWSAAPAGANAAGLCPACGAVNGSANQQCVMCSADLVR
jgi:hypothetical protein